MSCRSERRPADIWLPRGPHGDADALDFAITSGMRPDMLRRAVEDPSEIFEIYESFKRAHQATETTCQSQSLRFTPMVLEAHGGGWSSTVRRVVDWVARRGAASQNTDLPALSLKIAQRISCSFQRENARAVLRRMASSAPPPRCAGFTAGDDTAW